MELAHNYQVNYKALENEHFDLLLFASNSDARSCYLLEKLNAQAEKRIVLCTPKVFDDPDDSYRKFQNLGFEALVIEGDYQNQISGFLTSFIESLLKQEINILIDYSCMPSIWYSAIINALIGTEPDVHKIQLYFSYSQSSYSKPGKIKTKRYDASSLMGNARGVKQKPTALVIGLGSEKVQESDFDSKIQPDNMFAFFPDSVCDTMYNESLIRNNTRLLKTIKDDKLYSYPLTNTERTYSLLSSVCLDLRLDHKVVIAPMGPKPFSLNCHLLAAQYPDIQVLPVKHTENGQSDTLSSCGGFIINKVVFCNPEDWDKV